jgi:hypothetical protein
LKLVWIRPIQLKFKALPLIFHISDDQLSLGEVGLLVFWCGAFLLAVSKQCLDGLLRGIGRAIGIGVGRDIT